MSLCGDWQARRGGMLELGHDRDLTVEEGIIGFTLDNVPLYHPRALTPGLTVPLASYFKSSQLASLKLSRTIASSIIGIFAFAGRIRRAAAQRVYEIIHAVPAVINGIATTAVSWRSSSRSSRVKTGRSGMRSRRA